MSSKVIFSLLRFSFISLLSFFIINFGEEFNFIFGSIFVNSLIKSPLIDNALSNEQSFDSELLYFEFSFVKPFSILSYLYYNV
jgi:hypothetical protein